MNIRCVHEQVDRCIDDVIEGGRMDEYLSLSGAMSMGRVLEFQLSVLCDALVNCYEAPVRMWWVRGQTMDKLKQRQNEFPTAIANDITDFDPGDVGRHVECESDRELRPSPNMSGFPTGTYLEFAGFAFSISGLAKLSQALHA